MVLYRTNKSIVDMCCGAGALSKMLHDKNYKVCGVDLDNNAIKISKSRYPDVNFEVGDIRKWKPKDQVDCVIIIDCLTEFNPVAVKSIVKHLKTYIKKNGYLLITWTISNRYVFPTKEGGIHKRVFTFKQELLDEMPLDTYRMVFSRLGKSYDMNKAILMMKNIIHYRNYIFINFKNTRLCKYVFSNREFYFVCYHNIIISIIK